MDFVTKGLSDVKEKYELLEILGTGAFGVVRKCKNRATGEILAVKTIEKAGVDNVEQLEREIELLSSVEHPNIIKLYEVFEDALSLHIVTELCSGGELYDKVIEKAESEEGHFREDDATILIRDILDGIRYCHDVKKIVHRDLKPENFLLKDDSDDAPIKIIDFGLGRRNTSPFGLMETKVGTPYYVAPEVLESSYTSKCDIWSIGVIAYILLCGYPPFSGDDDMETIYLVQNSKVTFPREEWDEISDDGKDFVKRLLDRDPESRPSAAEALEHPWVAKYVVPPGVPKPRPFSEETAATSTSDLRLSGERRSAFQKLLGTIKVNKAWHGIADILTASEAQSLGRIFGKVDKNKDGIIDVKEIDQAVDTGTFSTSVKQNLKQMRSTLNKLPNLKFDIRPLINFAEKKSGQKKAQSA